MLKNLKIKKDVTSRIIKLSNYAPGDSLFN